MTVLSGVIGTGIRFPDGSIQTSSVTSGFISASVHSLVDGSLTDGRVTYAGTSGLLQDSDKLKFDGTYLTANSIKDSALTSGRVTYAGTNGLLQDSDKLKFDGTYLTANSIKDSALTSGRVTYAGTNGLLSDKNTFTFNTLTDTLSVPYITSTAITATNFYGTFHGSVSGAADKANTLLYDYNNAGTNYVSATNNATANTIVARNSSGDFSARNINLTGPVEVSGRGYSGPSFRMRDVSGGMIGFYDDTDPDPGSIGTIRNYTLNMDSGSFGFYFSTVNSPYDLGVQAANIDSTGLFSGTATKALYADLAENYLPDALYAPGTVLIFGGDCEVTVSTTPLDTRVAGVVSTNPAHLMNGALTDGVAVALQGRVPCQVVGTIRKGDMLVTSDIPGVATSTATPQLGTVIGKALEDYNSQEVGTIEVVVGRV
jgi:hypothetical protein